MVKPSSSREMVRQAEGTRSQETISFYLVLLQVSARSSFGSLWKWALKGCETAESETAETARAVVVDVQRSTSETAETARAVVVDVQMPTSETAETASRFDSFRIGAQSSLPCWKLYSQGFWRRAVSAVSPVSATSSLCSCKLYS